MSFSVPNCYVPAVVFAAIPGYCCFYGRFSANMSQAEFKVFQASEARRGVTLLDPEDPPCGPGPGLWTVLDFRTSGLRGREISSLMEANKHWILFME